MIMKTYSIIILLFLGFDSLAQNCPEYGKLIKDGDNDIKIKQFKKALNNFNAAKLCSPSMAYEVDKKINLLFDAIEKEKDEALMQKKDADMSKKVAEENLKKMSELIGNITELIQSEKTNGIIGFLPFKKELLNFLIPANQFISSNSKTNKLNNESPIAHYQLGGTYEDIGKSAEAAKEYNVSFNELKSTLNESAKNKTEVKEKTITTFLKVGMLISWNQISLGKLKEAKEIIDYTEDLLSKLTIKKTSKFYASLSGFENLKNNYFGHVGNKNQAFFHINKAIEFIQLAESLDSNNINFKITKAVFLKNSTIGMPDSLISKADKKKNEKEACDIFKNITGKPGNGSLGIDGLCDCIKDENIYGASSDVESKNKIKNLNQLVDKLSNLIYLDPEDLDLKLNRAWLISQIAQIELYDLKDKEMSENSINKVINDWSSYVSNNTTLEKLWKVRNIYNDLSKVISYHDQLKEKYILFEKMNYAFETNKNLYENIKSVSEIVINNYVDLANGKLDKKNHQDSILSKAYFNIAATYLERSKIIDSKSFDEKYDKYCSIYDNLLKINIKENKLPDAKKNYSKINELFGPYYENFKFDFYLGQHFWGSAMRYGKFLFDQGLIKEALPVLEYASKNGIGESTAILANLYRRGTEVQKNITLADSLEKYSKFQTMKKFTIPCDFGGKKAPFDVYVRELHKEYAYKGIEDQVTWLWEARGGKVPDDVRSSFIRLQDLANKYNVSFPELCIEALGIVNEEKTIEKYKPLKKEITNEKDKDKKRVLYKKLFNVYENDLSKESDKQKLEFIKKDATEFYSEYANNLEKDNKIEKNKIFSRILELDPKNRSANENSVKLNFELNMGNPEILCQTKDLELLKTYLKLYLEQQNKKSADVVLNKILTIEDNKEIRYEMSQLYYLFGHSKFESLFLSDTKKTEDYRNFFINKRSKISSSYSKQMLYYQELIKLDEAYLKINSDTITKKEAAQHYNSLSWNCLLSKDYKILKYLERSIELDADSPYPKGNLPHFYLFNNKVEKAKELYLKFKDLPFDKKGGYPTFKDAFLSDFKDFEKGGITHEKLNEIRELLMK